MDKPIVNPPIPYVGPIQGGRFTPGKAIKIQGIAPSVAYRFNINLQCGSETIARDEIVMQVAVRLLDDCITLNSLKSGIWGEEHRNTAVPIKRSEKFEIILTCDFSQYKVMINGHHYYEFPQRIHYDRITHLSINGDVSILQILYESYSGSKGDAASGNGIELIMGGAATGVFVPTVAVPLIIADDDFEMIDTTTTTGPPPGLQSAPYPGFTEPPLYNSVMSINHEAPASQSSSAPYPADQKTASEIPPSTTQYPTGVPRVSSGSAFPPPGTPIIPPSPPGAQRNSGTNYLKGSRTNKIIATCIGLVIATLVGVAIYFIKTAKRKHD